MARRLQASHRARSISGVLQVSSIASHVSAITAVASSRQQHMQGSTPASESDPFATLLDALSTASKPATAQADAASTASGAQRRHATASATTVNNSILAPTAGSNSTPIAIAETANNTAISTSGTAAGAKGKAAAAGTANKPNALLAATAHAAIQATAGAKASTPTSAHVTKSRAAAQVPAAAAATCRRGEGSAGQSRPFR